MGYDSTNYLATSSSSDVKEFLEILGYKKVQPDTFYFFNEVDYEYVTGVFATVRIGEDKLVQVDLRTNIIRSKADAELHNSTIKHLRKRFGGHFHSDNGTNRYTPHLGPIRSKAESGCYIAYLNFRNNLVLVLIYLSHIKSATKDEQLLTGIPFIDQANPSIISNNLTLPFLVAITEEYFKSTYVALARYSDKKEAILRNARFLSEDLVYVSQGEMKLEEAVTKSMSFQNIGKISTYFRELDKKYDIHGTLKKPYRRRKESLYEAIDRVFNQRHQLIHQALLSTDYNYQKAKRDAEDTNTIVTRVYEMIISENKWSSRDY